QFYTPPPVASSDQCYLKDAATPCLKRCETPKMVSFHRLKKEICHDDIVSALVFGVYSLRP
ncbi:hypothetical protein HHX47_DHR2000982, partial [Lentinula edodes]